MVRYAKYKKEYNRAEFTGDNFINKKLQLDEEETGKDNEKIIVKIEGPNSSKVLKNQRGYEIRQRERQTNFKKAKVICLRCRQSGHKMSACPQQSDKPDGERICYKCGATGHSLAYCPDRNLQENEQLPFAKCFICGESGHLSGGCSKNDRGKYPKGGACKVCGDVRHFGKDCPLKMKDKSKNEEQIFSDDERDRREAPRKEKESGIKKLVKVVEFK
jgi:zinc finger CCHC domain-containing protein 9